MPDGFIGGGDGELGRGLEVRERGRRNSDTLRGRVCGWCGNERLFGDGERDVRIAGGVPFGGEAAGRGLINYIVFDGVIKYIFSGGDFRC